MAIFCLTLEQIATLGTLPRKPMHPGRKVVGLFSNDRNCKFALFFRFEPRSGSLARIAMVTVRTIFCNV